MNKRDYHLLGDETNKTKGTMTMILMSKKMETKSIGDVFLVRKNLIPLSEVIYTLQHFWYTIFGKFFYITVPVPYPPFLGRVLI